jgi:hypothetical protein
MREHPQWAAVRGKREATYEETSNRFGVEAGQQIVEVAAAPQGFHVDPSR